MNRLKWFWGNLRGSFWLVPSLIVAFSAAFAVALLEADSTGITRWMAGWPRLFGAGAAGAPRTSVMDRRTGRAYRRFRP